MPLSAFVSLDSVNEPRSKYTPTFLISRSSTILKVPLSMRTVVSEILDYLKWFFRSLSIPLHSDIFSWTMLTVLTSSSSFSSILVFSALTVHSFLQSNSFTIGLTRDDLNILLSFGGRATTVSLSMWINLNASSQDLLVWRWTKTCKRVGRFCNAHDDSNPFAPFVV